MKDFYKEARELRKKKKYEEALKLYKQGIEAGDEKCWYGYAILLEEGKGIDADPETAMSILREHFDAIFALANSGDAAAMRIIGFYYNNGYAVEADESTAFQWFEKSANAGDVGAMCAVADCYEDGDGVEQNYAKAMEWYTKAAEQGNSEGQWQLGYMYQFGEGVEENLEEAVKWYTASAEQGNSKGQWRLGYMYQFGEGVEKNLEEAVKWYTASAEQGDSEGQCRLGYMYQCMGVEENLKEAVKWYTASAERGNSEGQLRLGTLYEMGLGVEANPEEAVKWYRKSAERDNPMGQVLLGDVYKNGKGIEKSPEKAVQWYRKAAEQDFVLGQLYLGRAYEIGKGVEKDLEKAVQWYRKAAEQDNSFGQAIMGWMYETGIGVKKNLEEAIIWYKKSANQNNPLGQLSLGCLYENGADGVEQNYELARLWYERSAANGYSMGYVFLGNLYREGRGVEASAEKAAKLWEKAQGLAGNICGESLYRLGYAYYDGEGVEQDLKKAKQYFALAIANGYQCSYALEMVKRELGEESKDNLMRAYAESIVKKRIPNDQLYDRLSKDLKKDFGKTWALLDKETKKFLISGLSSYVIYYSMGAQIYGNLDFSQSIIEMCKALERELGKYLYSGYVKFLKAEGTDPKSFNAKRPFVKKISASKYDYYSPSDVKKFTFGSFAEILGVERTIKPSLSNTGFSQEGAEYELKIDDAMATYLDHLFKKEAFSEQNRKREILHYIISLYQEVQSIADSLRNPSAHTNSMKYHRAEVCGNYIIKVKKLLKNFIDKIEEIPQ